MVPFRKDKNVQKTLEFLRSFLCILVRKKHYCGGYLKTDRRATCRKMECLKYLSYVTFFFFRLQELNTTSLALASSGVAKVERTTLAFSFAFSIMKEPH